MPDYEEISQLESDLFLKYDYPETKEMCKQFLTLTTTVLTISLTFSDKIIDFKSASQLSKWLIFGSWASFILAIILCGIGLLLVTMAAGEAVYQQRKDHKKVLIAFKSIVVAGALFILGLMLLIGTVISIGL